MIILITEITRMESGEFIWNIKGIMLDLFWLTTWVPMYMLYSQKSLRKMLISSGWHVHLLITFSC